MRVGVYGGTFDPPHTGHLILAADALRNLDLHRLLFVPAATQPFKTGKTGGAPPEARLEMVRLAVGGQKSFGVETV
ncbi:MAG: adenylyltransferase/cytidyltransferase family protein, partial [Gemmatimonadota bacterium]|nr:adenylyltransferase/cytidyltransferase family protein [Gemmatimonadota bacterium]